MESAQFSPTLKVLRLRAFFQTKSMSLGKNCEWALYGNYFYSNLENVCAVIILQYALERL
jgi:hypothetical protein